MLALLMMVLIVAGIIGIFWTLVIYNEGLDDASSTWYCYNNKHSGFAAWLYDQGYNANDAREGRKQRNFERNKAKREGRG